MLKICKECELEKDLEEFHIHASSKDRHRSVCKECRKNETMEYYNKNKERYNIMSSDWNKNNIKRRREIKKIEE